MAPGDEAYDKSGTPFVIKLTKSLYGLRHHQQIRRLSGRGTCVSLANKLHRIALRSEFSIRIYSMFYPLYVVCIEGQI